MEDVEDEIYNQEAQYIDIVQSMYRPLEVLEDRYDMNATRAIISMVRDLLMSQGMTRDEAHAFVNDEWYA